MRQRSSKNSAIWHLRTRIILTALLTLAMLVMSIVSHGVPLQAAGVQLAAQTVMPINTVDTNQVSIELLTSDGGPTCKGKGANPPAENTSIPPHPPVLRPCTWDTSNTEPERALSQLCLPQLMDRARTTRSHLDLGICRT